MENTGSMPDVERRESINGRNDSEWVAPSINPVGPKDAQRRMRASQPLAPVPAADDRRAIVSAAVSEWTRNLVNLDGHNRMLYFRELQKGTLDLSQSRTGVNRNALTNLLAGKPMRVDQLFQTESLADAALRTLALAAKARTNFEEKGLSTLHVGFGFATWTKPDGHTPRAPVVLFPARIRIVGPAGDDAVVQISGAPQVNPAFRHAMRGDLGKDPYPPLADRTDNPQQWISYIEAACADVEDFQVNEQLFLANFEFSKLPMVVDLDKHLPMLVENDVIAAIAGDETARQVIGNDFDIAADLPDRTPPEHEFLVCDADASQSRVISATLQGQSLVVHGPPGTGKSQTIANLISSLAAEGKSVLFVAEKRAAIGAVTRRLEMAGCGELVLDLHDGTGRRQVVRSLGDSLDAIEGYLSESLAASPNNYEAARKKLVSHRRQMHQPREPHGFSFFELQATVGTPDLEKTGVRLAGGVLEKWTEDGRAEVHALLERWHAIADKLDEDESGVWASSAIRTAEEVTEVTEAWERIASQLLPAVEDAHLEVLVDLGLPEDNDVPIPELSGLLERIAALATDHGEGFIINAENIAFDLASAERSPIGRLVASLVSGRFRTAKRWATQDQRGAQGLRQVLDEAREVVELKQQWIDWFSGTRMPTQVESGRELFAALHEYRSAWDALAAMVPALGEIDGFTDGWSTFQAAGERIDLAAARAEQMSVAEDIDEFGLGPLVGEARRTARGHDLTDLGDRVFAASAIGAVTWQEPELAMFTGKAHDQAASMFAELDRKHLEATAPRVLNLVAERAAAVLEDQPRQLALLRNELDTETYQMPVRQLLGSVTAAAKALRPCWAMSPLLVSQLLPAQPDLFDVVIFDEGSQILPIHALPAIARAGQVVVAGDPKQLPPSHFVASETQEDESHQENEARPATADAESILDVMRGLVAERPLLWHYRSQDERLINFSNAEIYGRSLVTFPATNLGTGVRHVFAEGVPERPSGTASNPEVVNQVVKLILDHARRRPEESLGVIAMGVRHANDLTRALRVARMELDEDFGAFFEGIGVEPFFIKVMTDVQGDERDRIILSIGYGKNPQGEMVYRWDALSHRGGERRLNVAITRAKRRMLIVSSIKSSDIDPARTRSLGARMLRDFLAYAESGGAAMPGPDLAPLTVFEMSVRDRLTEAGIPVESHYGGGPLRIDFAAFDSKFTNQPVLAIETDGLGYDSSATARDRDRIRLEVLAKRGWYHHRIWSPDWYRNPVAETERVKAAWVAAMAASQDEIKKADTTAVAERPVVAGRGRCPITIRRIGILGYGRDELLQLVQWIQSDGIQRPDDKVVEEAIEVLGLTNTYNDRAGRALRGAVARAAELAAS